MHSFDRGEQVAQFRQFVVMRGEERARTRVFLQMFDDGPGDREPIKRGGAASDLVEYHKTRRSGVIQDRGDFAHLHEKSGSTASVIIARSDQREYAVHDGLHRLAYMNKTA